MKTSRIITDTALHIKIPHLFAYELGEFTVSKKNITCNVDFRAFLAVKMFACH